MLPLPLDDQKSGNMEKLLILHFCLEEENMSCHRHGMLCLGVRRTQNGLGLPTPTLRLTTLDSIPCH